MSFYAARQPILDINKDVFAYELLFRNSLENVFPKVSDQEATSKMVEGLQFNLGLEKLSQNKLAFINFTHESLLEGYPELLPKDQIVVEVLETARPTKRLLAECQKLKQNGYILALDDYEHAIPWIHFYPYIDIIKIDFTLTSLQQMEEIISAIKPFPHIKLLAEKVETHEEFQQAVEMGFSYFQGYFFSKPEVVESVALKPSHLVLSQLMAELSKEDPDIPKLSSLIESDVNLSFKLLRYSQSPLFKRRAEVSNIRQAIVLLGLGELRRFVALMFAAEFGENKPAELTLMSLIRARFCELLALAEKNPQNESAFLVGLLSLLDAMLNARLDELLDKLPLSEEVKRPLMRHEGKLATYLHLCEQFEKGHWEAAEYEIAQLSIEHQQIQEQYLESLSWATEKMLFL